MAGLCVGAATCAALPAWATMTVTPYNAGGASTTDGVIWYAGSNLGAPSGYVLDAGPVSAAPNAGGFFAVDLTRSDYKDNHSLNMALAFYVTSTAAAPTNGVPTYLIVTTVTQQGASTVFPVAIAGVSNDACGLGAPSCLKSANGLSNVPDPAGHPGSDYYFAYPWNAAGSGQATVARLYPKDICSSYSRLNSGGTAQGCTPDTTEGTFQTASVQTTPASTGTVAAMLLTFQLVSFTGTTVPNPLPAPLDSATVTLRFEDNNRSAATNPQLKCPTTLIPYFPGDTQIFADTSSFSPSNQQSPSGYAPLTTTVVAGRAGSTLADATGTGLSFSAGQPTGYPGSYKVFSRVGMGINERVTGFENITDTVDAAHSYDVGFLVRDAAGMVYTPAANGVNGNGCILAGVQTSAIQGFLGQSSCFIATAAFRSIDASPVAMLREFRDRALLPTSAGKAFVRWYYRWSPAAAEWLMLHPYLRYPVLRALVPLQVGAWLVLHPRALFALAVALLGAAFALSGPALSRRLRA